MKKISDREKAIDQAMLRGVEWAGVGLTLTYRHFRAHPRIAWPSLLVTVALLYSAVRIHSLRVDEGMLAALVALVLTNMIWFAVRQRHAVLVHSPSYRAALDRAGLSQSRQYQAPRLLRIIRHPSGAAELVLTPTVPPEVWTSPEVEQPFCGAFGLSRFSKVYRDSRGDVHIVLAREAQRSQTLTSGTLDKMLSANLGQIPLGQGATGAVLWDTERTPHLIVAGKTGSGKSSLIRHILRVVLRQRSRVYLIDPKNGLDYQEYEAELAAPVASTVAEALPLLEHLVDEMARRREALLNARFRSLHEAHARGVLQDTPPIFLIFEEFGVFTSTSVLTKADKDLHAKVAALVQRLALESRAYGMHLILSSQYPTAEMLGNQVKQQCLRIAGRLEDAVASRTVLDVEGAERIPSNRPGMFLYRDGPDLERFQAFRNDL
jgi:S-DNA-T family DNA segregation ATPase FtsK/SpoIIIE